jgi:hypothetical protein
VKILHRDSSREVGHLVEHPTEKPQASCCSWAQHSLFMSSPSTRRVGQINASLVEIPVVASRRTEMPQDVGLDVLHASAVVIKKRSSVSVERQLVKFVKGCQGVSASRVRNSHLIGIDRRTVECPLTAFTNGEYTNHGSSRGPTDICVSLRVKCTGVLMMRSRPSWRPAKSGRFLGLRLQIDEKLPCN